MSHDEPTCSDSPLLCDAVDGLGNDEPYQCIRQLLRVLFGAVPNKQIILDEALSQRDSYTWFTFTVAGYCRYRAGTLPRLKCGKTDVVPTARTGKGERCPDGYELIERTPMDHNADLNHGSITSWGLKRAVHLAVRRQHVSKR